MPNPKGLRVTGEVAVMSRQQRGGASACDAGSGSRARLDRTTVSMRVVPARELISIRSDVLGRLEATAIPEIFITAILIFAVEFGSRCEATGRPLR